MKIKYVTGALEQYTVKHRSAETNYTTTEYICPLCRVQVAKRSFEQHVFKTHGARADEAFARLFGIQSPARCSCGKDLHYSEAHKGFPTICGTCAAKDTVATTGQLPDYKNADDAHNHVKKLEELLAAAKAEEVRLKKEAELSRIPLDQPPFPSMRYNPFMRRLAMAIRTHAVNGEQQKLFDLANLIDSKIAD